MKKVRSFLTTMVGMFILLLSQTGFGLFSEEEVGGTYIRNWEVNIGENHEDYPFPIPHFLTGAKNESFIISQVSDNNLLSIYTKSGEWIGGVMDDGTWGFSDHLVDAMTDYVHQNDLMTSLAGQDLANAHMLYQNDLGFTADMVRDSLTDYAQMQNTTAQFFRGETHFLGQSGLEALSFARREGMMGGNQLSNLGMGFTGGMEGLTSEFQHDVISGNMGTRVPGGEYYQAANGLLQAYQQGGGGYGGESQGGGGMLPNDAGTKVPGYGPAIIGATGVIVATAVGVINHCVQSRADRAEQQKDRDLFKDIADRDRDLREDIAEKDRMEQQRDRALEQEKLAFEREKWEQQNTDDKDPTDSKGPTDDTNPDPTDDKDPDDDTNPTDDKDPDNDTNPIDDKDPNDNKSLSLGCALNDCNPQMATRSKSYDHDPRYDNTGPAFKRMRSRICEKAHCDPEMLAESEGRQDTYRAREEDLIRYAIDICKYRYCDPDSSLGLSSEQSHLSKEHVRLMFESQKYFGSVPESHGFAQSPWESEIFFGMLPEQHVVQQRQQWKILEERLIAQQRQNKMIPNESGFTDDNPSWEASIRWHEDMMRNMDSSFSGEDSIFFFRRI